MYESYMDSYIKNIYKKYLLISFRIYKLSLRYSKLKDVLNHNPIRDFKSYVRHKNTFKSSYIYIYIYTYIYIYIYIYITIHFN